MSEILSIHAALRRAQEVLGRVETAALETEVLLAHVLATSRAHLHTWPEQRLDTAQQQGFFALVARRAAGEPLAYLTGRREFWSLDLHVNRHTLIPRPETERLVELALARLPQDREGRVADLGTGSGAIALALAAERPACRIIATDLSAEALVVARGNARRLGLDKVAFRHGDWFAPLQGECFDLIVANPPYIAEGDPHLAEGDLPAEPRHALVVGPDGLAMLAAIVREAAAHLQAQGWLLLEHGHDQSAAVAALLRTAGFRAVQTWHDHAGIERVTGGQRP
jgi:release factor glutamine methyltransferase